MPDREALSAEIATRVTKLQATMKASGFDALVVYGNAKHAGSLRYLSGYAVDRTGWVSYGPTRDDIFVFDGAGVVVPVEGEPVLLIEIGHMVDVLPAIRDWRGGGLTPGAGASLSPSGLAKVLSEPGPPNRVGVEPWDRIPAPLFIGLQGELPGVDFVASTLVEEQRLIKSPFEISLLEQAGRVADAGHAAAEEALRSGPHTELELIRLADHAMRVLNPVYEDASPPSTSKICTGTNVLGCMLHTPLAEKRIEPGDVVNWDICGSFHGYAIDTSRTRVNGTATAAQEDAYRVALEMSRKVRAAAKPGAVTTDLVKLADDVARSGGFRLWEMFLGHGLGMDCHERPDMGVERMELKENMVITVEPRVVIDGRYLLANEDMVLVTADGGRSFDQFPHGPLSLS